MRCRNLRAPCFSSSVLLGLGGLAMLVYRRLRGGGTETCFTKRLIGLSSDCAHLLGATSFDAGEEWHFVKHNFQALAGFLKFRARR